jgi:hypothetical protein
VGPDETVLENECVDAVVDLGLGGIGSPFERQNVSFIKLRFKVPFGLGYVPALPRCTSAGVMKKASSL